MRKHASYAFVAHVDGNGFSGRLDVLQQVVSGLHPASGQRPLGLPGPSQAQAAPAQPGAPPPAVLELAVTSGACLGAALKMRISHVPPSGAAHAGRRSAQAGLALRGLLLPVAPAEPALRAASRRLQRSLRHRHRAAPRARPRRGARGGVRKLHARRAVAGGSARVRGRAAAWLRRAPDLPAQAPPQGDALEAGGRAARRQGRCAPRRAESPGRQVHVEHLLPPPPEGGGLHAWRAREPRLAGGYPGSAISRVHAGGARPEKHAAV